MPYIDKEGNLHEGGDVYTVSQLYTPDFYAKQNPIVLVAKKRTIATESTQAVAQRPKKKKTNSPPVFIVWWEKINHFIQSRKEGERDS